MGFWSRLIGHMAGKSLTTHANSKARPAPTDSSIDAEPAASALNVGERTGIRSGDVAQMSPAQVARALGSDDLITGFEFFATHQLRTPLRILSRHGEVHRDMHRPPPVIATELWHGIWMPQVKTWRELGIDMPEFQSTVASDAGPVRSEEYMPFLIAVRSIVEGEGTVTERSDRLKDELKNLRWVDACNRHGGQQAVVDCFFRPFINSLGREAASFLSGKGIRTPRAVARVTDAELRAIKGIGPVTLRRIRAACSEAGEQDEELRDLVTR